MFTRLIADVSQVVSDIRVGSARQRRLLPLLDPLNWPDRRAIYVRDAPSYTGSNARACYELSQLARPKGPK
jgi:hypothetical protein